MEENNKRTSLVVYLSILPFIMVLGNSMFFPILPDIKEQMELSAFETSLFLSIFSVPAALLIPFVGVLCDRIGRKIVVLVSLVLIVLGCIMSIIAPYLNGEASFFLMLFGRLLQGAGAGGTAPLAIVLAGDLFTGMKRSATLGILEMFNGLGKVVSPLIGAFSLFLFWETTFYLYMLVCLIAFWGFTHHLPADHRQSSQERWTAYAFKIGRVFKAQFFWLVPIFLAGGAGMFLLFGLLFYLSFELDVLHSLDTATKGLFLALPLGVLTIVSYFSGKTIGESTDKMKRFIMFGLLFIFAAFSLLIVSRDLLSLLIFVSLAGAGLGLFLPAATTAVTSSVNKEERGMVVSLYAAIRFLGVAFGPISFSIWMVDVVNMFFIALSIIGGVTVILLMGWGRDQLITKRQSVQ